MESGSRSNGAIGPGASDAARSRNNDRLSYSDMLPRVVANQVFILLPAMVALQWAGWAFVGAPHIGVLHFIAAMIFMGVGHDVVQYTFHRYVMHHPRLVRKLGHSVHHSTGASKAISACFMSPIDFFLEIVMPYLLPLVLVMAGGDIFFNLLIATLGAAGGVYEHSGYDFAVPLQRGSAAAPRWHSWLAMMVTSKAHGEHHLRSNVSFSDGFGSPGLCDTVFATRWDKMVEKPRTKRAARAAL